MKPKLCFVPAAILAMACADATQPERTLVPDGAWSTITQEAYVFPTPGWPEGLTDGQIRLCKAVNPGDPGATFNFTVSTTGIGTVVAAPQLVVPAGGSACTIVYTSPVGNSSYEQVIITEAADAANWTLVDIDTRQILAQGILDAGHYPAPRLDDSESLAGRSATLYINNDMARVVTFTNDYRGTEGCTPGYWKNHTDSWPPTGYSTGQILESVFDVPNAFNLDNVTLLEAFDLSGGPGALGGAKLLLHHAVAALLNAAHPGVDYDMLVADIIADVNAALASGDRDTMLALKSDLDALNNSGCPLN